jgi:mono/diheme cytochrome c family protein
MFLIVLVFMMSCKERSQDFYAVNQNSTQKFSATLGKQLMETKCFVCHSANVKHDDRLAPPMMAVKKHYMRNGVSKEAFIEAIWQWVENPNEERASMHGAVKKFGVMPKQEFSREDIEQIAAYMYDHELEHPGRHHKR